MNAVILLEVLTPDFESVKIISEYLNYKLEKVESIREEFENDTVFSLRRPNDFDGNFAYIAIQKDLTTATRSNQYRKFYELASLAMSERGETSSDVDFIIVVGKKVLIVFDSTDYRRRLILTPDKLSRKNSKYLTKLQSLQSDNLTKKYVEDKDFGDIELDAKFKTELFRFAIADDEQFINKTRVIRLNFWKRIQEDSKCRDIIKKIFFKQVNHVDETSEHYGEVISAVLDTLVLRYILVRILEGRFGYDNAVAKKSVAKLGLGTSMSIDQLLESKVHFDSQQKNELFTSKKKSNQLTLFDFAPDKIDEDAISAIKDEQSTFMEEVYGGDLYVSEIAKAATQIEKTLTEAEYALIWNVTSSTDLDFDLEDVTPGTIGEQYEQTLQMKLVQDEMGQWVYNKDNERQRSQGSFYTSAQITDYIIEQTLGKKLSEIKYELTHKASSDTQRIRILKDILKLRIADISSGGGTFLAGAVRKLGNWYTELEKLEDIKDLLPKITNLKSVIEFQKYAVNHMIYGVDLDLKALIVSSFALTLESLGDTQGKLPELIGRTLIHQNSLISAVPGSLKLKWFSTYKDDIIELYSEKKKWLSKKGNKFAEVKLKLQNLFIELAAEYLTTKKYSIEDLKFILAEKHMEVLEFNLPEVFFDKEGNYTGGFDIIFGNPPYIQLQKKLIFSDTEKYIYQKLGEFDSYESTGDIYSLFFERGVQLLKPNGLLGFITSNKYLRAGYGKSLRNFFLQHTSPYLLVNLGSGMFGATVDTSILTLKKSPNQKELVAIDLMQREGAKTPKERLENMSDYIEQNQVLCSFEKNESWLILSPIEQSIKQKLEVVGTPLKDWNIRINRGILTGYNEAFIIDKAKRDELIEIDPKSAEIIRPILRGKDIKRYSYDFANKYLITTYNEYADDNGLTHPSVDVKDYPAIKKHLDSYWNAISKRQDKGDTPYNLRRCAYMDDFSKPKVVWADIAIEPNFIQINETMYFNNTCYMMVGAPDWLVDYLNSDIVRWYFPLIATDLGEKGTRYFKQFVERIPVPTQFNGNFQSIFKLTDEEMNCISSSSNE